MEEQTDRIWTLPAPRRRRLEGREWGDICGDWLVVELLPSLPGRKERDCLHWHSLKHACRQTGISMSDFMQKTSFLPGRSQEEGQDSLLPSLPF